MINKKILFILLITAVFSFSLSGCFISNEVDQSFRNEKNPLSSELSQKKCDVHIDERNIPHINAQDHLSGLACWGYHHGLDRGWQMGFLRRTLQGRRAEIYGYDSLKRDVAMRLLALETHAKRLWQELGDTEKNTLWAYTHGVNLGFQALEIAGSYELKKFNEKLEPWHPVDTLSMLLLQSLDQTRKSFEEQIREQARVDRHGDLASKLHDRSDVPFETTIIKNGEYTKKFSGSETSSGIKKEFQTSLSGVNPDKLIASLESYFPKEETGSNNWVVSPRKSSSGKAFLANDPHLNLRHPSFWHLIHLTTPQNDVYGAAIPGIPLVPTGANRYMAWGLTNSYLDTGDVAFIDESELADAYSFRPLIWIKAGPINVPFFFKKLRRTKNGFPILPLDAPKGKAIALRWTGFMQTADTIKPLWNINNAKSVTELYSLLRVEGLPSWNYVFADKQGSIGYTGVGEIFKNREKLHYGVPNMKLSDFSKFEFLEPDEKPHVINPQRGFVATGNNRQWPSDSQFHDGRAQARGYRANRIEELITSKNSHTVESMKTIQCDSQFSDAKYLLPGLLKSLQPKSEVGIAALSLLKSWDYNGGLECKACAIYERLRDRIESNLMLEEVGIYKLFSGMTAVDENTFKKFSESATKELELALKDLSYKNVADFKPWKDVHIATFEHLTGPKIFPTKGFGTVGNGSSVNMADTEWRDGWYFHTLGAPHRLVVELTSPPTVHHMLAGENKDNEDHDFSKTDGPWRKWAECKTYQANFPLDYSSVKITELHL